jgi:chorismate mutase
MVELFRRRRTKRTHDQESPAQQQRNRERGSQQRPNPRRAQPVSAYSYVSQAISHMRRAVLVALVVLLPAPQARADNISPLTELVDAAAARAGGRNPWPLSWLSQGVLKNPESKARALSKNSLSSADAAAKRIDEDYVARVFGDQINGTEAIEYSRFADWKFNPSDAPAAAPDLSASRSTIDALNQTMLTQIALNWDFLHSPACAGALDAASSEVIGARRLDNLYQRALALATRSYCS